MRLSIIRNAILSLLKKNFPDCAIRRSDNPRPVNRAEFIVVLPGFSSEKQSGGARFKNAEIEIWYRAQERETSRDEIEQTAEMLDVLLTDGFSAGSVWLCPEEKISFTLYVDNDAGRGFYCQFSTSWMETAIEPETEPMEDLQIADFEIKELRYERTENHAGNDAEN